jgi:hypothetical protein
MKSINLKTHHNYHGVMVGLCYRRRHGWDDVPEHEEFRG